MKSGSSDRRHAVLENMMSPRSEAVFSKSPCRGEGDRGISLPGRRARKTFPLEFPLQSGVQRGQDLELGEGKFCGSWNIFFGLKNSGIASTTCELDSLHFFDGLMARFRDTAFQRGLGRSSAPETDQNTSKINDPRYQSTRGSTRVTPAAFQ